ncbi:MAG: cytochrome P450 [Candidatus Binatia bacterium]|jgi:cytochrome P450
MNSSISTSLNDLGGIFVDPAAYTDLDDWHRRAKLLREQDPVHRVELAGMKPFWAITTYDNVWEIERQHQRFPNTLQSVLFNDEFYAQQMASGLVVKSLVHMDGAEHRAYRGVTNDWFKPANLRKRVEGEVARLARKFVDKMMNAGPESDFSREIALLFPLHVIMSILGVPEKDEPRMLQLTQQLFASEDPEFDIEGDALSTMLETAGAFFEYFNALTDQRRKSPIDDIASVLANAKIDGEPLGDIERVGYYMIIATAGHDTTANSLSAGIEALCNHPDQLRALQADPSGIDLAVDEIIRWSTPVRHFLRYATEDCEIGGKSIANGDALLLSYLSANRDEKRFADPLRFDAKRANASEHLAFGTGVHFCLGAHLARLELRTFLRELLPRLVSMEVAGPTQHVRSHFVGGLKNLPLRYAIRPAN